MRLSYLKLWSRYRFAHFTIKPYLLRMANGIVIILDNLYFILRPATYFPLLKSNLRRNTLLTMPCICVKCSEQFLPLAAHDLSLLYQSSEQTESIACPR